MKKNLQNTVHGSRFTVYGSRFTGFTFLELLLTMSMLSVIALLSVSYLGNVGNVSVDAASWKIQSDIRYAQQLSTSSGTSHGVQFTQDGNYVVYIGSPSTPVLDPLERTQMIEDPEQFGNIRLANSFQVEFDSMGRPTMGGGGYVEVAADSGAVRRIYVYPNTGSAAMEPISSGCGWACDLCRGGR